MKLTFAIGSCGTDCRYDGHKLWLCTTCKNLFHHICHGEGRDMNTCKRCTELDMHNEIADFGDMHPEIEQPRSEHFDFIRRNFTLTPRSSNQCARAL